MLLTFRPLVEHDLALMHRWLNEPGVVQWWEGDDVSWDGVVRDYSPAARAAARDATEHWIVVADGVDVGWIQCWDAADEPDEVRPWLALGVEPTAAGIDYLIGEPGRRGRGLGAAMLRSFVEDVVFGQHPQWTQACAAPYAANTASWRALEKAGFRFVGIVDDKDGPCRLMAINRAR